MKGLHLKDKVRRSPMTEEVKRAQEIAKEGASMSPVVFVW